MADATPGDTSNTPTAGAAAPATAPATAATPQASATDPAPTTTSDPAQPAPAATDSPPATAASTTDTAPKTDEPQAAAPVASAFTVPEDLSLAPEAVAKFTDFVKSKSATADGKVALSPQEIVDLFADQARNAQQRWQAQLAAQNKTWEAESKARFTAPQLAAAETGIGFLTSYEPAFRELAASYRNNPSFVNAMRIVGERLSEDTFERGSAAPTPAKRAPKDILYPKRATN